MKLKGRRVVVFCEGKFGPTSSKVATSYLRYCSDDCVAVIDSTQAGSDVHEILGYGAGIPIVASLDEARQYRPEVFMVGVGLFNNALPAQWRATIRQALELGMDIVAGLHFRLSHDPEFAQLAQRHGCHIWDTKEPPTDLRTSHNRVLAQPNFIIHTVGSDCRVGKKTTSIEIVAECERRGQSATMAATGQSGIYISGQGIAVDAVPADFIAGAAEQLVLEACEVAPWVVVEGQGAISHPAYSGVTLGLLHGAMPEALILCHQTQLEHHKDWADNQVRPLKELITIYEQLASYLRKATVVAISVNCDGMSESDAEQYLAHIEQATGLPTTDVILFGAGKLVDALEQHQQSAICSAVA